MVLTRTKSVEAFEHILANVFCKATDSPLRKALLADGIEEIYDLISMENDVIDALTYNRSDTERNVSIPSGDKTLIRIFLAFFQHCEASGNPIADAWTSVTRDKFSEFRVKSWAMRTASAPTATTKVIYRSRVQPFTTDDPNFCADMSDDEDTFPINPIIRSHHDDATGDRPTGHQDAAPTTPVFHPEDLVGRTFLLDPQEDGQRHWACIVKLVQDHEDDLAQNPSRLKFLCSVNNNTAEEVISYNQMLDFIARDAENPVVWKFCKIVSHQGPLFHNHPDYNGSSYNIMIERENGEVTSEPLATIAADDPVTCATYAKEQNLLHLPGWKRFKPIAKRQKKFTRMVNQAKLRSFRRIPKYKYGFEVPTDFAHAKCLDARNGNTHWQDATDLELTQIDDYNTFQDWGDKDKVPPPTGYKNIRVHLVFDGKHDGRHKACIVADGHPTDIPLELDVPQGTFLLEGWHCLDWQLVLF